MYDLHDTVAALATAPLGMRTIIRISGPDTLDICRRLSKANLITPPNSIVHTTLRIDDDLTLDTCLYVFFAPASYTGQDLVEIHVGASHTLVQALVQRLLSEGIKQAGPGEFTARAYLLDKMDLSQAEAVNEIITSSNRLQCAAAERLLAGHLLQKTQAINELILELLSLIEAGLDFSNQDITIITTEQAIDRLQFIQQSLEYIHTRQTHDDTLMHLPSVGIAGMPNAGKSTLFNALIGSQRSIVSDRSQTTRDVLAAPLSIGHYECVLFDCAGLLFQPVLPLDKLAQQTAIEALQHSRFNLFCVDISKSEWHQELSIYHMIKNNAVLGVATKADLLKTKTIKARLITLTERFQIPFLPVSAQTGQHITSLLHTLDQQLTGSINYITESSQESAMLSARQHTQVTEALEQITASITELSQGNDEIAAMMLRTAYQAIQHMERHVNEKVLDTIFSRFCIGK